MRDVIQETLPIYRNELVSLFSRYVSGGKKILQSHHLTDELIESAKEDETMHKLRDGPFFKFLQSTQEAIVLSPFVVIAVRPKPGVWEYFRVNGYELTVDHLSVSEYLRFKEELVDGGCIDSYIAEVGLHAAQAVKKQHMQSSHACSS